MKYAIIIAALIVIGTFVGAGFALGNENAQAERCAADGGVTVEAGTFIGEPVCIDESAVIW